jgi:anti-sigma-K factor RskA
MNSRDPRIRETLAGEYVLGTLHGPARQRFERWLKEDAQLRQRVDAWERHLHPLVESLPPIKPPTRVWHTIEQRIKPTREEPRRLWEDLIFWRTVSLVTSAALALLLVISIAPPSEPMPGYIAELSDQRATIDRLEAERSRLATDLVRRDQELVQERALTGLVSHIDTRVASLAGIKPTAARAAGWIVWSPEKKRGFIVVHFLPPLPAGKQYQLWVIAGRQALPAGVFNVDAVGHNALTVQVGVVHPDRFEITAEPVGGRPVPSGPVVMKGSG